MTFLGIYGIIKKKVEVAKRITASANPPKEVFQIMKYNREQPVWYRPVGTDKRFARIFGVEQYGR